MPAVNQLHHAATRSLASVMVTAIAIAINHLYSLGSVALALGGALILVSTAFLLWFRKTGSRAALVGYLGVSLWITIGFGIYKGLWFGVLRLFLGTALASMSTAFPKPAIGAYAFEASGVLMFVGALFVAFYGYELFVAHLANSRARRSSNRFSHLRRYRAPGLSVAAIAIVGAYVAMQRDVFVAPPNGVVTIGVISPLTGPYAILGNSFVKAVEMARHDLRGTRYRYQLRIEDSGPDPAQAVAHVTKVIQQERVNAVVGAVSLIGEVTKPFATKARIAHVCICTVRQIGDGAYNFTNIPSPEAEAVEWVAEAHRRGIRTVGIVQQDYPSVNNHVNAMKVEAARRGLRIVFENRFKDTVSDFRAIIASAKNTAADVYYIEALEPSLDLLAQQLVDANVRNIASVVAPSLSEKPWLFEEAWYTDSDLDDAAFKDRFEAKYPGTQFATHMMPYAYDSFNMIVRAYEQGINPAAYIRNLARYVGVAGPVTKKPGNGNFESTPTVWVISNGKPVLLRDVRAAVAKEGTGR